MISGIAVRISLLMVLGWLVKNGNQTLFSIAGCDFNLHNVIMLVGGLFLLYKTVKEIHVKFEGDEHDATIKPKASSFTGLMLQIVLVDMI